MTPRYGDILVWRTSKLKVMFIGPGFEDNESWQAVVLTPLGSIFPKSGQLDQFDTEVLNEWHLIEFER